ncbi:hypothetical protein [Actinomadura luteofluorescens]|uniref:hypothetical protein n=1 Tax=Actinomadura luteofluorescens TaxID=46163 RepID=UPI003D944CDE
MTELNAEVRQRIELLHFLTFAAPPKNGNGRITAVTLKGREDLEALAALIGTDVPRLLAEVKQLGADLEQARWCAKELEKQRDAHKAEAEQSRATLDGLRALTQDEDGNLLPPESELPVGVFYGLLYGEEGQS